MKASMLSLMVATVAFGGSSAYLWRQLDEERGRAVEVQQATQKLQARVAELERARSAFDETRVGFDGGVAAVPGGPLRRPPTSSAITLEKGKTTATAPELSPWTVQRREVTPAMKRMMRANMRTYVRRMYADVGDTLGLDKETAAKLEDLIVDQQTIGYDMGPSDPGRPPPDWEAIHRQQEKAIADLIGPDKLVSLEQYQESMPARQEFAMLAQQLESNDQPLNPEQSKKLLEAYVTERARVPMPTFTEGTDGSDFGKAMGSWQADYAQRVSEAANRILNPDQLTAYNEILQWQKDMREQMTLVSPAGPVARGAHMGGNASYVEGVIINEVAGPMTVTATPAAAPRKQ